jgi:hypothetical protein
MKAAIAVIWLVVNLALAAVVNSDDGSFDPKFVALLEWATDLGQSAVAWNAECGGEKADTVQCKKVRAVLDIQFQWFIDAAKDYKAAGSGCWQDLRARVIKHEVRVVTWNKVRAGKHTETLKEGASAILEGKAIDDEQNQLTKEIKQCVSSKEEKL